MNFSLRMSIPRKHLVYLHVSYEIRLVKSIFRRSWTKLKDAGSTSKIKRSLHLTSSLPAYFKRNVYAYSQILEREREREYREHKDISLEKCLMMNRWIWQIIHVNFRICSIEKSHRKYNFDRNLKYFLQLSTKLKKIWQRK